MITNNADLVGSAELGWGWRSITKAVKKTVTAPTKLAYKATKYGVQKTLVDPTKIAARGVKNVAKGSASVASNVARGKFKAAGGALVRTAVAPVRTGYDTTKHFAKTGVQMSKAVTNFVLAPLRSRLNTLKNRRAELLSYKRRGTKAPTVAERAQARKDVKSMLSAKGPHGKMLSWLAGPDSYDGLGVVGYDDAALAAIATALTASAVKIIQDAAKSKFAPVDAAKAGVSAGGNVVTKVAVAKLAPVAERARAYEEYVDEAANLPAATAQEVANETAVAAEEAAMEAETEEMEGALASAGMLGGFKDALPAAAVPEAMPESMARKIAGASQRVVCGMPTQALAAIGGLPAVNVVGSFCRSLAAGDEAGVRATLPNVVKIASRISADVATQAFSNVMPNEGFGCSSCLGQGALQGIGADEIGMLAAFNGADLEGLAFGLAGVSPDDIAASSAAGSGSSLVLLPAVVAVLAGLWMATH